MHDWIKTIVARQVCLIEGVCVKLYKAQVFNYSIDVLVLCLQYKCPLEDGWKLDKRL